MPTPPSILRRVASAGIAAMSGDLILGMTCFSSISLGGLWYFALGWIHLTEIYSAAGFEFGTAWQWELAWLAAVGAIPLMGAVIYLGFRALHLPGNLYRAGRDGMLVAEARRWMRAHRPLGLRLGP